MRVAVVNYAYDQRLRDPEELLDRYHSLTGWCEALVAAGASSVTVAQRFGADASINRHGVEYRLYNGRFPSYSRLARLVERARADIVHVNGLDFPIETALLRRSLRSDAALVVQDHASGEPGARGSLAGAAKRGIRRLLMRPIDGFFFTSAAQADPWRRARLISDRQPVYEVVEASTAIRPIDRMTAKKASGIDGDPAVLWVGRLNANKDPLTALDGFERSLARLPSAKLSMIYSEDDFLTAVRQRIASSPALPGRVVLRGSVPHEQIASFYSAADIFLVGSHHESAGYALIEACACGVMPIVTNIPAFAAITNHGSIGSLWSVGDASALADALARTAQLDRRDARDRVLAHFARALSWAAVGDAAMRAYRDVVTRRRAKLA